MRREHTPIQEQVRVFLEDQPLYAKVTMEMPRWYTELYPEVIFLPCWHCGETRPFRDYRSRGGGTGQSDPILITGIYAFRYTCTGCEKAVFTCWVEVNGEEGWLRKVGQVPPWDISISKDIVRFLGEDSKLLKRAKVCMSQSYGLAASAYLRRLLENKIGQILQLLRDVQVDLGASASVLQELDALITSKSLDEKLTLAYKFAPASIIVNGNNPLKTIYERLSDAIHNRSDEEALQAALSVSATLEYVVAELNRQHEARAEYAKRVRELAGGDKGSS